MTRWDWKKINNISIKLGLAMISGCLSYKLVYFIGETYFFDKFFYQKSIKYGYGEKWKLENYGERSEDLLSLEYLASNKIEADYKSNKVLGVENDNVYKIAVIGDSIVWGEGLKNDDRFVEILEKKLNKIYPTKVFSFSECGDSILENYIKYKILENARSDIDLYIFGLVKNDLIFKNKERYDLLIFDKIVNDCADKPFYFSNTDSDDVLYKDTVKNSFDKNFGNFCVLEKIADLLPKEKTIYFDFSIVSKDEYLERYISVLREKNLFIKKYIDYTCKACEKCDCYFVSEKERHPSVFANKKYAETLYNEIITNSEYQFPKK